MPEKFEREEEEKKPFENLLKEFEIDPMNPMNTEEVKAKLHNAMIERANSISLAKQFIDFANEHGIELDKALIRKSAHESIKKFLEE